MEIYNIDELRAELTHLLQKQFDTHRKRPSGSVSDTEIIEDTIRKEVIRDIQWRLARSKAA